MTSSQSSPNNVFPISTPFFGNRLGFFTAVVLIGNSERKKAKISMVKTKKNLFVVICHKLYCSPDLSYRAHSRKWISTKDTYEIHS